MQDLHAELAAYNDAMVEAMVLDDASAFKRQHKARAEELGLQAWDHLNETASLPTRIAFLNDLHAEVSCCRLRPVNPCSFLQEMQPVPLVCAADWGRRRR